MRTKTDVRGRNVGAENVDEVRAFAPPLAQCLSNLSVILGGAAHGAAGGAVRRTGTQASAVQGTRRKKKQAVSGLLSRNVSGPGTKIEGYSAPLDDVSSFGARSAIASLRLRRTRPLSSMPIHLTHISSPSLATSSVFCTRKSASSEM